MKATTAILLLSGLQLAIGQVVMQPSNQIVELKGRIREIHGYGSPGYGENKKTDERIRYLVLELPVRINIPCTPERTEWRAIDCGAARRLKLFFPSSSGRNLELRAHHLSGHRVIVSGRLQRQDTAGEMTPIYIDVTDMQPASSGR